MSKHSSNLLESIDNSKDRQFLIKTDLKAIDKLINNHNLSNDHKSKVS